MSGRQVSVGRYWMGIRSNRLCLFSADNDVSRRLSKITELQSEPAQKAGENVSLSECRSPAERGV